MTEERKGAIYALSAYTAWGLFPAYWKLFGDVASIEILAHRWTWATIFYVGLLYWLNGAQAREKLFSMRGAWKTPVLTGALMATNWGVFVYAVTSGRVLESSLGYFLSPLVQVVMGAVILNETVTRTQFVAAVLAFIGVLTIAFGGFLSGAFDQLPWIAVTLALTFSVYGLLRKRSRLEPIVASTFESLLYLPLMGGLLFYLLAHAPAQGLTHGTTVQLVGLVFGGAITALPLLWYTEAGKRLPLKTVGFFQYVSPTLQFLLAVLVYHEPISGTKLLGFGVIWAALALYLCDYFGVFVNPAKPAKL